MHSFSAIDDGIIVGLGDQLGNNVGHGLGVRVLGRSGELEFGIPDSVVSCKRVIISLTGLGV